MENLDSLDEEDLPNLNMVDRYIIDKEEFIFKESEEAIVHKSRSTRLSSFPKINIIIGKQFFANIHPESTEVPKPISA